MGEIAQSSGTGQYLRTTALYADSVIFRILPVLLAPCLLAQVGEPQVYKKIGARELRLWVLTPEGPVAGQRRPAAVFFHGGGWVGGKPTQFDQHARHLAGRGMVAVQVEYRLLAAKTADPPIDCLRDARSALRWVRAHAAQYGIDPGRIAAGGGSAGGHLAAALGLMDGFDDPADDRSVSPRANALLLFNPVFDNGPGGWGHERTGERYREFSPFHNIAKGAPPAIVFVGSQDKLLPVKTVEAFRDKMRAVGARCETFVYEGQGHGFFNYRADNHRYYDVTLKETDAFLVSLGWLR